MSRTGNIQQLRIKTGINRVDINSIDILSYTLYSLTIATAHCISVVQITMQPECTYTYRRKHFTMMKTLSRSSGAVQVRDMAPATPPANRWRHHIPDFISTSVKSSGTSESSPMSKRWSKPETGFHDRSSHGFATATAHFKLHVLHAPYIINCFEIAHYYPVTGHVSPGLY